MRTTAWVFCAAVASCLAAIGCDEPSQAPLAPTASALEPTKAKTSAAVKLEVEKQGSKVELMMEAPQEKIRGRVADAMTGEVFIDPSDITKTTAHLHVNIAAIELYQQVAADDGSFAEEEKNPTQNEHARQWLEIGPDAPEDLRAANEKVEFVIQEVIADPKDVTKIAGDERKVTATVKGDLLLHGRKTQKTAKLAITFRFKDDKPQSVHIATVEPFAVGLSEHDVKPREAFGKLAAKTLEVLAPKVAKEARVSLDFSAKLIGMANEAEMESAKETPKSAPDEGDTKPAAPAAPAE